MSIYAGAVFIDVKFDTSKIGADLTKSISGSAAPAAKSLGAQLEGVGGKLSNFGTNATRVGRQVSFGISAPLLAVGKAAVEGFSKFEASMTRIETLVGASHDQVQQWTGVVKEVGTAFGVGAQEAADAMYFITSSGLSGGKALDALRVSAKASAVGLGDMTTISDLLTSALNAYGPSGLTATKAVDALLVAVREGKNEPEELAGSMGRVFPIASKLGVSFEELAGSFAAMSLNGTKADEAATQLRGILNSMLDPTKEAVSTLKEAGLTVDDLQTSLRQRGLISTLQLMRDKFGDSSAMTAKFFGNVRALTGAFTLLGANEEENVRIIQQTRNATGQLTRAFDIVKDTAEFKMNKAMASLKTSLIEVGQTAAPVAQGLVEGISKAAAVFTELPGPVKTGATAIAAIGIVAGPAIYSLGAMASILGSFVKAVPALDKVRKALDGTTTAADGSSQSVGRLSKNMAALGGVVALGAVGWGIWAAKMGEAQQHADALADTFRTKVAHGSIDEATKSVAAARKEIDGFDESIKEAQPGLAQTAASFTGLAGIVFANIDRDYIAELEKGRDALKGAADETQRQIDLSIALSQATGATKDDVFAWVQAEEQAGNKLPSLAAAQEEFNKQRKAGGAAAKIQTDAMGQLMANVDGLRDAYFGVITGTRAYEDAQRKIVDAQKEVTDSSKGIVDAQRAYDDAVRASGRARQSETDALRKVEEAQRAVIDAQNDLNDALAGPSADEQLGIESAQLGLDEARKRLAELGKARPGEKAEPADPLDKRRAELDVRRAELDLQRAQEAQTNRVTQAQESLTGAQDALTSAQTSAADAAIAVRDAELAQADAKDKIADAGQRAQDATLNLQRANEDALPAADALAGKQQAFADALANTNGNIQPLIGYLEAIKSLYPDVAAQIDAATSRLDPQRAMSDAEVLAEFARLNPGYVAYSGPPTAQFARDWLSKYAPHRAFGGSADQDKVYEVGERGLPEMFSAGGKQYLVPARSGRVVPLKPVTDVPTQPTGPALQTGDIIVNTTHPGEPTAFAMRRELRKESFLAGRR